MISSSDFDSQDGDSNFRRNFNARKDIADDTHAVIKSFRFLELKSDALLEVGSSTGFVLARLQELTSAKIAVGLEISSEAVAWANQEWKNCSFVNGSLDSIPPSILSKKFDCIILGFYLFLVEPMKWNKHILSALELLSEGGHLIVYDFYSPHISLERTYLHNNDLTVHKSSFLFELDVLPGIVKTFQWCWMDNYGGQVAFNEYTGVCVYKKLSIDQSYIKT